MKSTNFLRTTTLMNICEWLVLNKANVAANETIKFFIRLFLILPNRINVFPEDLVRSE